MSIGKSYNQFIEGLEFSRLGFICLAILIDSALGGIAIMFVFENKASIWELILGAGLPIANLVVCLVVESTKWVFNISLLSAMITVLLITINAF